MAAGAALVALAGCVAQPIGVLDDPEVTSANAQAQTDLVFRPGSPQLLPGEAERVNAFLAALVLREQDDVVLRLGQTGSDRLNAARVATARRSLATGPARLRIVGPLGFGRGAGDRPDIALVQAIRYDSVRVTCPPPTAPGEIPEFAADTPLLGCANAVNVATMTVDKRDLSAPRVLGGSDDGGSVRAVERYRADAVKFTPLGTN